MPDDKPKDEPGQLLDRQLTAHNAAELPTADEFATGALNAYRRDVLVVPTELLARAPGLPRELNDLLQPAHPDRPINESVAIDPASAVTVLPLRPGADAEK